MASKRKVLLRNGATQSDAAEAEFAGSRAIDPAILEPHKIIYRAAGEWHFACGACTVTQARPGPKAIEAAWVEHVNVEHAR